MGNKSYASLSQCNNHSVYYVALCTAFAKLNESFTERLTKNERKKGVLSMKSYVGVQWGIDASIQSNADYMFQGKKEKDF